MEPNPDPHNRAQNVPIPDRDWVFPFVDWAETNEPTELDFGGAKVPPTLQRLLINGLPGMHPAYGKGRTKPWWNDADKVAGLVTTILMVGASLFFLALGIWAVRSVL
jgi:hypothetical protein